MVDDGQGGTTEERRYSIHRFVTGARDNYYALGFAIVFLIIVFLTVLMTRLPGSNRLALVLSVPMSLIVGFVATRWLHETRKLAMEWCATERQLHTMLRAPKGFRKRTLSRMAHVLIEQEGKINALQRHTGWLLARNLAPPSLGLVMLGYLWTNVTTSFVVDMRRFKIFLREWNVTADNREFIRSIPRYHEFGLDWLFMLIGLVLLVVMGFVWMRWNYSYVMVTDKRYFPDLRLPPIWLPFMSKNELANDLTSIRSVDNIDEWRHNILGYGSVEIASDVERTTAESDVDRLRVISHMSNHRVLARKINTAVQEAKRTVSS